MNITQEITLDLSKKSVYQYVSAKEGDSGSRFVKITLTNNGVAYQVPQEVSANFRAQKPDGTMVLNQATVNGDGTVTIELTQQTLAVSGDVYADVFMVGIHHETLSSASFVIHVEPIPEGNKIDSKNEFLVFLQAVEKSEYAAQAATEAAKRAEQAASNNAPKNHAAPDTTYGTGSSKNYGHVRLSDNGSEIIDASAGIAATPKAVVTCVAKEEASRKQEIAVERARIDSFTALPPGETAGNAELVDIRVGYDGKKYPSAGDALRTQVKTIYDNSLVKRNEIVKDANYFTNGWVFIPTDKLSAYINLPPAETGITVITIAGAEGEAVQISASYANTINYMDVWCRKMSSNVWGNWVHNFGMTTSTEKNADNFSDGWVSIATDKLNAYKNLPPVNSGIFIVTILGSNDVTGTQFAFNYAGDQSYLDMWTRHKSTTSWGNWVHTKGFNKIETGADLDTLLNEGVYTWYPRIEIKNTPMGIFGGGTVQVIRTVNGVQQIYTATSKNAGYAVAIRNYYSGSWGKWHIIRDRQESQSMGFLVIGDSLSSGWVQSTDLSKGQNFYRLSWGAHLAKQIGCTYYLSSTGGLATTAWLDPKTECGISKFRRMPKVPVYFIWLGANDAHTSITAADYVKNYKQIIAEIKSVNPDAIIFCCPTDRTGARDMELSNAMVSAVNADYDFHTDHVMVLDATDEIKGATIKGQLIGTHYSPYGYKLIAKAIGKKLEDVVAKNKNIFGYSLAMMVDDDSYAQGYPYIY